MSFFKSCLICNYYMYSKIYAENDWFLANFWLNSIKVILSKHANTSASLTACSTLFVIHSSSICLCIDRLPFDDVWNLKINIPGQ